MDASAASIEIKIHGVSGTPPERMLGIQDPRRLDGGNDNASFYGFGPGDPRPVANRETVAFSWAKMTSGRTGQALWLLLLPFGLLNVARFMTPTSRADEDGIGRRSTDGILRVMGLALTLLLIAAVTLVTVDMLGWQGFPRTSRYGVRLMAAVVLPIALIVLISRLGRSSYLTGAPGSAHSSGYASGSNDAVDASVFWHDQFPVLILRVLHTVAAVALVTILVAYSTAHAQFEAAPSWTVATLYVVAAAAGVSLLLGAVFVAVGGYPWQQRSPVDTGPVGFVVPGSLRWWRYSSYALLAAAIAISAVRGWTRPVGTSRVLYGFGNTFNILFASLALGLAALFAATWRMRRNVRDEQTPQPFRPIWHGYAMPIVAATAMLFGTAYTGGLAFSVAYVLHVFFHRTIAPPPALTSTVYAWGLALFATVVVVTIAAVRAWIGYRWTTQKATLDAIAIQFPAGQPGVTPPAGRGPINDTTRQRIAKAWWIANLKYRAPQVFVWLAILGGLVGIYQASIAGSNAVHRLAHTLPTPPAYSWIGVTGAIFVIAVAVGLSVVGLVETTNPGWRRGVGVIWDLLAFWPRRAHPIAPQPYGANAVITLADWVTAHRQQHDDVIILSGHSQGSLIALATTRYLIRNDRVTADRLRVMTYGSQLQWAYSRMFPAYVGLDEIRIAQDALHGAWFNLHRWTDQLGAPVLAYPGVPAEHGYSGRHLASNWMNIDGTPAVVTDFAGARRYGTDEFCLRDPDVIIDGRGTIRAHCDYSDADYNDIVTLLVNHVVAPSTRVPSSLGPPPPG